MSTSNHVQNTQRKEKLNIRHVFIRELVLPALIGVHKHEKNGKQNIRVNLDMAVPEASASIKDRLSDVVCYENVVEKIRAIIDAGHINLVETLAENIAESILEDKRILEVKVRIEKLDIITDATSVGIEIIRKRLR